MAWITERLRSCVILSGTVFQAERRIVNIHSSQGPPRATHCATISSMRFRIAACALLLSGALATAKYKDSPAHDSVTVPATIDHNRVVVDAEVTAANGSTEPVHAWVDNGNAEFEISRRLATTLGLAVSCDDKECSASPPPSISIGGMSISLATVKQAKIPLKPVSAAAVLAPGMKVEINLPSTVLRQYDILVDFPGRKFSIGPPGSIHFYGSSSKALINADNGLIQIPSQIEKKKLNLALDLGSCISFLSSDLFDKLATAHPDWPHMTGAVGSANMWGLEEEPQWKVMRVDRVQYGPLFLMNVAVVEFTKDRMDFFEKRAGIATAGLLGSQALLNYRVGVDYARGLVYFDIGRTFTFPDFDVVGLVLRPEDNRRYTVLGVAALDGKASFATGPNGVQSGDHLEAVNDIPVRGSTMGQVWSMIGGNPGQERKLTFERGGKEFTVVVPVQHFLGEVPDQKGGSKK